MCLRPLRPRVVTTNTSHTDQVFIVMVNPMITQLNATEHPLHGDKRIRLAMAHRHGLSASGHRLDFEPSVARCPSAAQHANPAIQQRHCARALS